MNFPAFILKGMKYVDIPVADQYSIAVGKNGFAHAISLNSLSIKVSKRRGFRRIGNTKPYNAPRKWAS